MLPFSVRAKKSQHIQTAMTEPGESETLTNTHDEHSTDDNNKKNIPSLKNLPWNDLLFCLFLYMAQGLVIGNNYALPMLLIDRNWSLLNLTILSLAFLPYSLKIFIAPIVDSYYIKKLGYRKTWICGMFAAGGVVFLVSSFFIEDLMSGDGNQWPILCILITLTATQAQCQRNGQNQKAPKSDVEDCSLHLH